MTRPKLIFLHNKLAKVAAEKSLHEFVKQAWPIVEPDQPFVDNWHIRAICDHLEAVTDGRIGDMIINVPPGTMKSLLVSVFWFCWVWATRPGTRWMFSSYNESLSTRDSVKCRNIITSEWYQNYWGGKFELTGDQNVKTHFANTAGGWRLSTGVGGGGTGQHPDFNITDDPHKVKEAESDAERAAVIDWWDGTMATRGVIRGVKRVIVMQRVHAKDLSGHCLDKGGYTHICLPMRYEEPVMDEITKTLKPRMPVTPIGWQDPRTTEGDLLWSNVYTEEKVAKLENNMGIYHTAGQLQQRPSPRGGSAFERAWFAIVDALPPGCVEFVRYWDKACLTGDVLVSTPLGRVPITAINTGDSVFVQDGIATVKRGVFKTKESRELVSVLFSNGQIITGTPDHLVKTKGNYWVELATLGGWQYNSVVWQTISTKNWSTGSLMGCFIQEKRVPGIFSLIDGVRSANCIGAIHSTVQFGGTITDLYPVASIFTTRGTIGITMTYQTLSVCPEATICSYTGKSLEHPSTLNYWLGYVLKHWMDTGNIKKQNGINGIALTEQKHSEKESEIGVVSAKIAELILKGGILSNRYTVQISAKKSQDIKEGVPVYDIEVEGAHEFFANDILVHNSTKGGTGAETASTLMAKYTDNRSGRTRYIIVDCITDRLSAAMREALIKQTAKADQLKYGVHVTTWVEQEPGSGGKESAEATVTNLGGFVCYIERVTGSKEVRAEPLASQASVGNVELLAAPWNAKLLEELEMFPVGKLKDMVDASSGAFNKLFAPTGAFTLRDIIPATNRPELVAVETSTLSDADF